jgi:hypothetical protein
VLTNATNFSNYDAAWQNALTTVGDTQISTVQVKWPSTSTYFDGTGDYLTAPLTPNTTITSGNFTVEFWLYLNTVAPASQAVVGTRETDANTGISWGVYVASNQLGFGSYDTGNALIANFTHQTTLAINNWYYCALTRNGSTFTLYVNGVASTSTATSANTIQQPGTTLWIGRFGASSTIGALNGYLQDLRITKGLLRTVTTIPTQAFLTYGTSPVVSTTPTPTYSLSSSSGTVNEGGSFTITLTTGNVANGTTLPYVITGVSSSDIGGASLSGNFTITDNVATLVVNTTADVTTEVPTTLPVVLVAVTTERINLATSVAKTILFFAFPPAIFK